MAAIADEQRRANAGFERLDLLRQDGAEMFSRSAARPK
jgi:hypothetical protein